MRLSRTTASDLVYCSVGSVYDIGIICYAKTQIAATTNALVIRLLSEHAFLFKVEARIVDAYNFQSSLPLRLELSAVVRFNPYRTRQSLYQRADMHRQRLQRVAQAHVG